MRDLPARRFLCLSLCPMCVFMILEYPLSPPMCEDFRTLMISSDSAPTLHNHLCMCFKVFLYWRSSCTLKSKGACLTNVLICAAYHKVDKSHLFYYVVNFIEWIKGNLDTFRRAYLQLIIAYLII